MFHKQDIFIVFSQASFISIGYAFHFTNNLKHFENYN